jgi:hypothetical protein
MILICNIVTTQQHVHSFFYLYSRDLHVSNLKVAGSRPDEVNDFNQVT